VGQEWLREHGMDQEPRLLYLPDSFGHSPGVPSLARAAGVDRVAVCRIAGMRFPGADLESASHFPRPGTAAAELIGQGTADFVWRAPDGAEVLSHWMSHGYGHGDMIARGGISRALGLPVSWSDRRPDHVDRRIDGYLDDLRPLARTPYRLLAIGFDFVRPVPGLVELLDGWNERHHDRTGTWLVNAAMDDYFELVGGYRDQLPTIDFDPNPYWMGFYATRPDLKAAARKLGRRLIAADAERARSTLTGGDAPPLSARDQAAWWTAMTSNHHDFITGTAPDGVALGEQADLLRSALGATSQPDAKTRPGGRAGTPAHGLLAHRREGERVTIDAPWGSATFDCRRGGALVSLADTRDTNTRDTNTRDTVSAGSELLAGPSLELASHVDSGGLWRMGQELNGGRWSLAERTSRHPATLDVQIAGDVATVTVHATLEGRPVTLVHTLTAADPTITTHTTVRARARRTVTLVARHTARSESVSMHQPGAMITRPLRRWYDPTFWPLHTFASLSTPPGVNHHPGTGEGRHLAVATATPTGLHVEPDGTTEVVVARTA
ncbi:MAG: hypothetical protein ACK5O2_09700, partial [Microthrixaceae bacterium]